MRELDIEKLAFEYFKQGYYCSEAVVKAFEDTTGYRFSDDFKKSLVILGEGIGESGCICGAVNAAVLIAGVFTGRLNPHENKEKSQKVGKEIISKFKEKYMTTCCKSLKKKAEIAFGVGQYKHCPHITAFCAKTIYEIMMEENFLNQTEK